MPEATWNPALLERAQQLWAEYQKQHDISGQIGQTAGIDPVSGQVWSGDSSKDIWRQHEAAGIHVECYFVRVGTDHYLRKGSRR